MTCIFHVDYLIACFLLFVTCLEIQVFPICYMLYRSNCFRYIYIMFFIVQKYYLCVHCVRTDLSVWSEVSQDIQHSLLQHFHELLVAGV